MEQNYQSGKLKRPLGTRVEMIAGPHAGLRGTVISSTLIHVDMRGHPISASVSGLTRKKIRVKDRAHIINWTQDVAVRWDDGRYSVVRRNSVKTVRKNSGRR
jgi:hypothetical protein